MGRGRKKNGGASSATAGSGASATVEAPVTSLFDEEGEGLVSGYLRDRGIAYDLLSDHERSGLRALFEETEGDVEDRAWETAMEWADGGRPGDQRNAAGVTANPTAPEALEALVEAARTLTNEAYADLAAKLDQMESLDHSSEDWLAFALELEGHYNEGLTQVWYEDRSRGITVSVYYDHDLEMCDLDENVPAYPETSLGHGVSIQCGSRDELHELFLRVKEQLKDF